MGTYLRHLWHSEVGGIGTSARDRAGGPYSPYLPDLLAGRDLAFGAEAATSASAAGESIARFDERAVALRSTEALARLLLRAESVASSKIEGLEISAQRLLRVDRARDEGDVVSDASALEVLANVDAMSHAIGHTGDITTETLIEIHRRLLAAPRTARIAGKIRERQNWIGGSDFNPIRAAFIPPPPGDVPALLEDLCRFCNEASVPAVAQAAIAHAAFETIHPFEDGNGRTGRALIYLVLRRRGLARRTIPPISLVLATFPKDYERLLDGTRCEGDLASQPVSTGRDEWIVFFSKACLAAVKQAETFETTVRTIQRRWRDRLPALRADSTALALIDRLPESPILTVNTAAALTKRTYVAASRAIAVLIEAQILKPLKAGGRNRTFEARELISAFTSLERRLASPLGNTVLAKPVRGVPARPDADRAR